MSIPSPDLRRGFTFLFSADWIHLVDGIVRTYTCMRMPRRRLHNHKRVSLGDAHFGRHASFLAVSLASRTNLVGHNMLTSFVDRHKNINFWRTSMATEPSRRAIQSYRTRYHIPDCSPAINEVYILSTDKNVVGVLSIPLGCRAIELGKPPQGMWYTPTYTVCVWERGSLCLTPPVPKSLRKKSRGRSTSELPRIYWVGVLGRSNGVCCVAKEFCLVGARLKCTVFVVLLLCGRIAIFKFTEKTNNLRKSGGQGEKEVREIRTGRFETSNWECRLVCGPPTTFPKVTVVTTFP